MRFGVLPYFFNLLVSLINFKNLIPFLCLKYISFYGNIVVIYVHGVSCHPYVEYKDKLCHCCEMQTFMWWLSSLYVQEKKVPLECYITDANIQIQGDSNELSCGI